MDLELLPESSAPLVSQLAFQLSARIRQGVLAPGDRLPTVRQLADQLGIHFNTVARAYRVLEADGLVTTQRGRGTYVRPAAAEASPPPQVLLEQLTLQFLQEAYRYGFGPQEVHWEFASDIRAWMQRGEPPGME